MQTVRTGERVTSFFAPSERRVAGVAAKPRGKELLDARTTAGWSDFVRNGRVGRPVAERDLRKERFEYVAAALEIYPTSELNNEWGMGPFWHHRPSVASA